MEAAGPPEAGGMGEPAQVQGQGVLDPNTMQGALAAEQGAPQAAVMPQPAGMMGDPVSADVETKDDENQDLDRWTVILERSIERLIERQQRVVSEKAFGQKSKKALLQGDLDVEMFMSEDVWRRQYDEDLRPVLMTIMRDSPSVKSAEGDVESEDLVVSANAAIARIQEVISESSENLSNEIRSALGVSNPEIRFTVFKAAVTGHFTQLLGKKPAEIAAAEARRAWRFRK